MTQRYTALYRNEEEQLIGFEVMAHDIGEAQKLFGYWHKETAELITSGNTADAMRAYETYYSYSVRVYKVTVTWAAGTIVYLVGANEETDAWACVRGDLSEKNDLGLVLYGNADIKELTYVKSSVYGIIDIIEFEN